MSEIQLYQQPNSLSGLPQRVSEIKVALSSKMIKDLSEPELFEIFKSNISKCYVISRFAAPEGIELTVIVDETMKMAKSRFGNLRVEEISIAFTRGLAKEYGDYMGLSFVTFVEWIKSYMKEEDRINLTKPAQEVKPEPTQEERFDLAASNAVNAFETYKLRKDISLIAPVVYRFLRGIKCFSYSEQEQRVFISEATNEVINELTTEQANTLDKFKRIDIGRTLNNSQKMEDKIIIHAQRLGLYAYFQTLIMEDADLKQLLQVKKEEILS
jgi:hypothetical protein